MKKTFIALFLLAMLLVAGCGDPSPEQKKADLTKATDAISVQLKQLDEIVAFWKDSWAGIATGKVNRAEGKDRMNFIFMKSMDASSAIKDIERPKWLNKEASEKFKQMIDEYNLAANSIAAAARASEPLMTKDQPSQFEMDKVKQHIKEYQQSVTRGAVGYAAFKNGYGLEPK